MITIIAAVSLNGVIGRNGRLPWDIPEDRAHFARTTGQGILIMGRKTWESLPDSFYHRRVIVLSRSRPRSYAGFSVGASAWHGVDSLNNAIRLARDTWPGREIFIAGGAQVYAEALPIADRLILSRIMRDYEGDTYFPDWKKFKWATKGLKGWGWQRVELRAGAGAPIPWRIETWKRSTEALPELADADSHIDLGEPTP